MPFILGIVAFLGTRHLLYSHCERFRIKFVHEFSFLILLRGRYYPCGSSCRPLMLPAFAYSMQYLRFSVGRPWLKVCERERRSYVSSGVGKREMEDREGSSRIENLCRSSGKVGWWKTAKDLPEEKS